LRTGGQFQDLNNLIPAGSGHELTGATGINDSGQIVATGYHSSDGQTHAFVRPLLGPHGGTRRQGGLGSNALRRAALADVQGPDGGQDATAPSRSATVWI
jgi:hypothetical protein